MSCDVVYLAMATITRFTALRHLRADPNQYIVHYQGGKVIRHGAGLSYWFLPLSAAIAQVPVEDCETTIMIRERTSDMQEVAVQCTIVYRFADPQRAATRANFTISLVNGAWLEKPLERIAAFWAQRVRAPVRGQLVQMPLTEAVRFGSEAVRAVLRDALSADTEVAAMGVVVVGVSIDQVTPPPDLTKALETPTREAIQQKADEAMFQRRALAVEKERAIKENELATKLELARREEEMIRRQSTNALLEVQGRAASDLAKAQSEQQRTSLAADGYAKDVRTRAAGDAEAKQLLGEAEAKGEAARAAAWRDIPPQVLWALAAQALAGKLEKIEHVTITPDTFSQMLGKVIRGEAER